MTQKNVQYVCTGCKSNLVVDGKITMGVHNAMNGTRGILRASPIIGDYSISTSPTLKTKLGDRLNVLCPCCGLMLNSDDSHWGKILLRRAQKEYYVLFSTIIGENVTYKLGHKSQRPQVFGPDAEKVKKPNWSTMLVSS